MPRKIVGSLERRQRCVICEVSSSDLVVFLVGNLGGGTVGLRLSVTDGLDRDRATHRGTVTQLATDSGTPAVGFTGRCHPTGMFFSAYDRCP